MLAGACLLSPRRINAVLHISPSSPTVLDVALTSPPLPPSDALARCRYPRLQVLQHGADALAGAISTQLERVVFVEGDHIVRAGEESTGMYFISSGAVEIIGTNGQVLGPAAAGISATRMFWHPFPMTTATSDDVLRSLQPLIALDHR